MSVRESAAIEPRSAERDGVHNSILPMALEAFREPSGNLWHVGAPGRRAVHSISDPWKIQRLLDRPDIIVALRRENLRRLTYGNPANRHRGVRRQSCQQMYRAI